MHGIKVSPSGRLPSCLSSPERSLTAGIPAAPKARQTMSLRTWCLAILPGAFLQTMAWRPWASTRVPQWQLCKTHKLSPSLIPTATRTASSSRRKPQLAIGRARSQSPLCGTAQPGISLSVTAQQERTRWVHGQSEDQVCPRMTGFLAKDQVVDQPMRTMYWSRNVSVGQGHNDRMSSWGKGARRRSQKGRNCERWHPSHPQDVVCNRHRSL